MFIKPIITPLALRDYLRGYYFNDQCFLFAYPPYAMSNALKQVSTKVSPSQAAFHLSPFFSALSWHDQVDLAALAGMRLSLTGTYADRQVVPEQLSSALRDARLTVYSVPAYYYDRLCDYLDIFYRPINDDHQAKDAIAQSTGRLWQALGGDTDHPPATDLSLPPLKFPVLAKLGSVEVDLSERVVHTRSRIVPSKLAPTHITDPLAKELEQLGCGPELARTALDRGLKRWRTLSDYRYGRQCLNFFWVNTDPNAQHLIIKRASDEPSYVFRLPAEVFLALGGIGFKNRQGITDPRRRIGPFNMPALEAMATLADQLTSQAELAEQEAEALRDDTGPQSRSHEIWADLPTNYFVQVRLKYDNGTPVENESWWIQTPDGREHTGRTNLHGVGRVSGLKKMGTCQIKFPKVAVAKAGAPRSSVALGEAYTEAVNGEYEFYTIPPIRILYQIDVDAPGAKKEEIILEHNQSDWEQRISVGSLIEFDHDWVELAFHGLPESGTFNLIQDPKDGGDPYFIFDEVPFEKLDDILCDLAEPTELEPEDDEDADATTEDGAAS